MDSGVAWFLDGSACVTATAIKIKPKVNAPMPTQRFLRFLRSMTSSSSTVVVCRWVFWLRMIVWMPMNTSVSAPTTIWRPPGAELSVELDQGLDDDDDEDAEQGAEDVPHTARQERPADDDGGDDRELHAHGIRTVARSDIDAQRDPGQRRAQAAERVDQHLGPVGRQPHQARRAPPVAADRVDRSSEARVVRDEDRQPHEDHQLDGDEDRDEHSPCLVTGSASPGISSFVPARTSYSRLRIGIALSLMKKDRPRATHRPASVAMNGWTLR